MTVDLKAARVNLGLSQRGLARKAGVTDHVVRKLERGERVHPASAKKVADHLGCQVTDLMSVEVAA